MEFFEIVGIAELAFMSDVYKNYFWAYFVIGGCLFAVLYIFQAIALYTIAKREGFKNKWFAFVPFLNTYYIGVVSDKNNVFRAKAKTISLIAAIAEAAYCALSILYYVAESIIFKGGYAQPIYRTMVYGTEFEVLTGYELYLPDNLFWAGWIYSNMQDFILYWFELVTLILKMFVYVAFFRTYASPRYVLFSILSALFPLGGVFMFAVRNNRGKNYMQYIREQQQKQYRMYQEYMRSNGGDGNGANYGGQNDPYSQGRPQNPPDDPFGGLGTDGGKDGGKNGNGSYNGNSGGKSGNVPPDPFDDF